MGNWSDYALSDFLMFAPDTYFRLYERINADGWPFALVATVGLLITIGLAARQSVRATSAIHWALAVVWVFVAWAFFYRLYAPINLAAQWFAAGFLVEALALVIAGWEATAQVSLRINPWALALLGYALIVHPLTAAALGRDWAGVELFGLAPDPTALATLAVLLMCTGKAVAVARVIPLLWCVISGLTYAAMDLPYAWATPAIALLAMVGAWWSRRRRVEGFTQ